MQNPVPDERYSVADEAILGAFFKLLKKKNYRIVLLFVELIILLLALLILGNRHIGIIQILLLV